MAGRGLASAHGETCQLLLQKLQDGQEDLHRSLQRLQPSKKVSHFVLSEGYIVIHVHVYVHVHVHVGSDLHMYMYLITSIIDIYASIYTLQEGG